MKVICLGNRFIHPDGAALWLYDQALKKEWPLSIEWIEGGLGGLNLSPHFDTKERILLIDYMPEHTSGTVFNLEEILEKKVAHYDHANALYYLLHCLPELLPTLPSINCMSCNPDEKNWQQHMFTQIGQQVDLYEKVV